MTPASADNGTITAFRVFYQGMVNVGIDYTFLANTSRVDVGWNPDFLLASMYQKGGATAAAGDYCTGQAIALTTAASDLKGDAAVGFPGTQKCTFQATSTAAMGAPTMRLIAAGAVEFQF